MLFRIGRFTQPLGIALCFSFVGNFALGQENAGRFLEQIPEVMESVNANQETSGETQDYKKFLAMGPKAKWIWGASDDRNYILTRSFTVESVKQAILSSSCDNHQKLSLNGKLVGESSEWSSAMQADVTSLLRPGENKLVVEARNDGGPAAFVLKLAIQKSNG